LSLQLYLYPNKGLRLQAFVALMASLKKDKRQDIPEGFATQKLEKFSTTISFVFVKNLSVPGEP
jgi:hypothetical protein